MSKAHKNGKWRRSQRGQSLVEFTASLTVLLILLSGVLDIGRAFFTFVAIENAAGEGALFASYHPTWEEEADAIAGGADYPEYENITYRAAHESPTGVVDWTKATITVERSTLDVGQPITVTVTYSYTVVTPFFNALMEGNSWPLQARATQMILNTD